MPQPTDGDNSRNPITGEAIPFFKKADTVSETPSTINGVNDAAPAVLAGGICPECGNTLGDNCEVCARKNVDFPSTVHTSHDHVSKRTSGHTTD